MGLTVHFLRHGQTTSSRHDNFCGSGLDPELTADGLLMAKEFATAYQSTQWAAIYSSNLRRTIDTARPICLATSTELQVREELQEIAYGAWEGLSKEQVAEKFPNEYEAWLRDPAAHAPTGGELASAVSDRASNVISEIRNQYQDGNVLLVSHKATIRIMLCNLLGIELAKFRYRLACPVSSVSKLELTENGPMLLTLGDRSHLDERLKSLPGT
ncbi:MAG TPA: histidine phosphatase family protein [Pyrinomonadaceae bacterium]|nr:histidine phosphatase family protein [Pyrinomonadaceae bacterium]